ncbi:hypothetical protein LOTGIDRAFT_174022 [Lottia gigantea]|uniref:Uncharacterized protein n=1 Tax=Lottia gigantea TaxID=225164 RepID=V4APA1_LOTGI|nr:hypothetical protein LOTGIDRAFT_174022 [Lottia gigantea]ESO99022.1 hypothetical protein LOTGIDRAFT_174022 [Lottia gigantea]
MTSENNGNHLRHSCVSPDRKSRHIATHRNSMYVSCQMHTLVCFDPVKRSVEMNASHRHIGPRTALFLIFYIVFTASQTPSVTANSIERHPELEFCEMNTDLKSVIFSPCTTTIGSLEQMLDEDCQEEYSYDLCSDTALMRLFVEGQVRKMRNKYYYRLYEEERGLLEYFNTSLPTQASLNVSKTYEDLQEYFIALTCAGKAMDDHKLYVTMSDSNVLCDVLQVTNQLLCNIDSAGEVIFNNKRHKDSHLKCHHVKRHDSSISELLFVNVLSSFRSYLLSMKVRCNAQNVCDDDY